MLDQHLSDDIDARQMMASVSYLCFSLAIRKNSSDLDLYKNRLLLLRIGADCFQYTVMSALDLCAGGPFSFMSSMADITARDAMYKMEIADLYLHPQLYQLVPMFMERKIEFDKKIEREFFRPECTLENVIESGVHNHRALLQYLEAMVLHEEDLDFCF